MKIAGIREVRAQSAALLGGDEPVLVTKHGKISGVYLPLEEPDKIPDDLRWELALVLGRLLSKLKIDNVLWSSGSGTQKETKERRPERCQHRNGNGD